MIIIAPSLLNADWTNIGKELKQITHPKVKWIHYDVMDGKFVPAKALSLEQLKEVKRHSNLYIDVHLMVADPIKEATNYANIGVDSITYHFESTNDQLKVINHIKSLGCKVGISIKPTTPVDAIKQYLSEVDIVLVMSVEPGKGGQAFIPNSIVKIQELKILQKDFNFLIEVDGGVKDLNSQEIIKAGADVLVAGSYIFKANNYNSQVEKL